jgi:hypothetical protein
VIKKARSTTSTAACLWQSCAKIYGQSFAAGLSPTTTLYEALELFGPHAISEMHLTMLQRDYNDGLLEKKSKKSPGAQMNGFERQPLLSCPLLS